MVISNTWFVGYTRNRLYGILSPKVTYGSAFGGGGSGIGGIKSDTQIHEFCIVRSLKLCSFLGCKWGVPLVIGGGGGGGWGVSFVVCVGLMVFCVVYIFLLLYIISYFCSDFNCSSH